MMENWIGNIEWSGIRMSPKVVTERISDEILNYEMDKIVVCLTGKTRGNQLGQ